MATNPIGKTRKLDAPVDQQILQGYSDGVAKVRREDKAGRKVALCLNSPL